ncbi:hypothetical protein [Deinococcus altitudinis]|uniref:hypothetical protein n=1 Tax=Deinococcus altitudinis TaxID=468914 RepID=UPI003892B4A2
MKKNTLLTPERFVSLLNEAGWSVQANGQVLCLRRGAGVLLSADRTRGYLHLRTGVRTLIGTRGLDHVRPPPDVTVDGVRIVSFERADLRDMDVLREAAALFRDLGEMAGAPTRQGGDTTTGVRRRGRHGR